MNIFSRHIVVVVNCLERSPALTKVLSSVLASNSQVTIVAVLNPLRLPGSDVASMAKNFSLRHTSWYKRAVKECNEWKAYIACLRPDANVQIMVRLSLRAEKSLVAVIGREDPSLVIGGRKKSELFTSLDSTKLSKLFSRNNSPSFLIQGSGEGNVEDELQKVVLAVNTDIPHHHITTILQLGAVMPVKIFIASPADSSSLEVLLKIYMMLKHELACTVERVVLENVDFEKSVFQFAESIEANMVLTNQYSSHNLTRRVIGSRRQSMHSALPWKNFQ